MKTILSLFVVLFFVASCGGGGGQETVTPPVGTPPIQEEMMEPETTEPEAVPEEPEFPCLTSDGAVEYLNEIYEPEGRVLRRESKSSVKLPRINDRRRGLVSEAVDLINKSLPSEHGIEMSEALLPEGIREYEVAFEYVETQELEDEIALVFTSDEGFFPAGDRKGGTNYPNYQTSHRPDGSSFIAIRTDAGWNFDPADPEAWDRARPRRLYTVIHELIHALGLHGHIAPKRLSPS